MALAYRYTRRVTLLRRRPSRSRSTRSVSSGCRAASCPSASACCTAVRSARGTQRGRLLWGHTRKQSMELYGILVWRCLWRDMLYNAFLVWDNHYNLDSYSMISICVLYTSQPSNSDNGLSLWRMTRAQAEYITQSQHTKLTKRW